MLELGPGNPSVLMDPSQMDQLLLNLVLNARDAMRGGGTLTLGTTTLILDQPPADWDEPDFTPGERVILTVADTGEGMDPATASRVFEPFFTTKEIGEGSGLGLATVYGIVKQNGGHIRLTTEPGRGTTFRICLPMAGSTAAGEIAAV
jgi:two-component system, cell cycle sensor histidine kinase and response regulator CckA